MAKSLFTKTYRSPTQLVSLLQERGMQVDNEDKTRAYLHNIGYYRLSAYFYPLLEKPKQKHIFKTDSSFKQALNMYRFDRKLRVICFDQIEKIEVAIRSIIVNTASEFYNSPFWITNQDNFKTIKYYDKRLSKHIEINCYDEFIGNIDKCIKRSTDDFIKHFKLKYSDKYPPSWMIVETLTFGDLSRIYKGIKRASLKKKIANKIGLEMDVLESWMLSLSTLRNICCHHGRLWNKVLPFSVTLPIKTLYPWLDKYVDNKHLYLRLCIINYLLLSISPNNNFKVKLVELLNEFPSIDIKAMGFQDEWLQEPLWK